MAGLVDQYGRAIDLGRLKEDIGGPTMTGTRSVITGHPAEGLTPERLQSILRGAEANDPVAYLEMAEQMEEKDPHYLSVLGTRKRAVTQLEITVEAAGTDAASVKQADRIREWLDRDELVDELFDVQDGVGKGYSLTNLVWRTYGNEWLPERLEWRDPRWFTFDLVDGRTPMLLDENGLPQPLPPFTFMYHQPKAKSGLPIRGGLARPSAWAYLFKNYALKDWVAFAEIFGLPVRVGRYDNGETAENIRRLANAVASLGSDASAVFPKSMEVEFVDGKEGSASGDLFEKLCTYCDQQISKVVVGQTATTDATIGGLGSGKEHGEVRADIRDADALQLAGSINRQIVRPVTDLNDGPQKKYPRVRIGLAESLDLKTQMDATKTFVSLGGRVSEAVVRDQLGYEEPGPDERILGQAVAGEGTSATPVDPALAPAPDPANPDAPATGQGKPPQGLKKGAGAPTPAEDVKAAAEGLLKALKRPSDPRPTAPATGLDAIDHAVAAAGDDWELLINPVVAAADRLIAGCSTLEEARDRLAEVMGAADMTALTELLARGSLAARMAGLAGDEIHPGADR